MISDITRQTRTKLNLGCGLKHISDAINLDLTAVTKPEVVHDLNRRPWPFTESQFNEVLAYDVIEHLDDIIATLEELHRICSPGAVIKITVPHFSCANTWIDPTHRHAFSYSSFDYVTGTHEHSFYTSVSFRYRVRDIVFAPTLINRLVRWFAHRYPEKYEQRWAWMFPAWFLYFELEVVKEQQ